MILRSYRLDSWDWTVCVAYDVLCKDAAQVEEKLRDLDCPREYLDDALGMMDAEFVDCGFTYTSRIHRTSFMVLAEQSCTGEFVNTEVHEICHVGMHIARFLGIDFHSEEICYICGDLAQAMHEDSHRYSCKECRGKTKN